MTECLSTVRMGTRGSALARWQTDYVGELLTAQWPDLTIETRIFTTQGDRVLDTPLPLVGGKGLFTAELEAALRGGDIDVAVHSLKDLPTEMPEGLSLGAIPERVNPADALISREGYSIDTLPHGATVGTSSRRRAAQLLHQRPDLRLADIRGNVDTRIKKAYDPEGPYDAIILACAGLQRLGRLEVVSEVIPLEVMLPAPGQGALGIQCRDEPASLNLLAAISHHDTTAAVTAERALLAGLGGGCSVPVAAHAIVNGMQIRLHGRVSAVDGSQQIEVVEETTLSGDGQSDQAAAHRLGNALAQNLLAQGAAPILEAVGG